MFEAKWGKIFNFFPTEEELKELEIKKLREAEEFARQAEEERRHNLLKEEEEQQRAKNAADAERLQLLELKEKEELFNLAVPLRDYMDDHVVPTVGGRTLWSLYGIE